MNGHVKEISWISADDPLEEKQSWKKRISQIISFVPSSLRKELLQHRISLRATRYAAQQNRPDTSWPKPFHYRLFLPIFPTARLNQDYKIMSEIGKGAFGVVHRVIHIPSKQERALKTISKSKILLEGALSQCRDEVALQQMVGHHPLIVNLIQQWQDKKFLYIVTEYMAGGDLLHLWEALDGSLPQQLVKSYIAEAAAALAFLHSAGIIYRDLKMENLLLDCKGHLRITDFGLSKPLKYGDRTSTMCGTLQYMAPEVLSSQPYTHAVDWWSLGILAYALLQGKYPSSPPVLPSKSCPASSLLRGLLQADPSRRIKNLVTLGKERYFSGISLEKIAHNKPDVHLYFCEIKKSILESQDQNVWKSGSLSPMLTEFLSQFGLECEDDTPDERDLESKLKEDSNIRYISEETKSDEKEFRLARRKLESVRQELQTIKEELELVEADLKSVEEDLNSVEEELWELKSDVEEVELEKDEFR
ncbi:unnamed protein product [Cyprideis torosa]|uniref:Uncharacterized protein n=1 Tax=Cyprideis torosa TaxID=163714 RepID=A0A7R8W588_9CRUS|nr:unnamed protein product [Cyprideis torosa]CAG0882623.1 unnamed protein product [Cyprideis torosa]